MKVRAAFRIVTLVDAHETIGAHVSDQDPCHSERQPQHR